MGSPVELITRAVGLQQTTLGILAASAQASRQIPGVDSTFVAVADQADGYPMLITGGIRDPLFRKINVRPGAGPGGQVLLRRSPHSMTGYPRDPTISRDFVHVVCDAEGLRGMACVPVNGVPVAIAGNPTNLPLNCGDVVLFGFG